MSEGSEVWADISASCDDCRVAGTIFIDGNEATEAQLRVAACAPEALRMLLEMEFSQDERCPWCSGTLESGHLLGSSDGDPPCEWFAIMKKAGLR